MKTLLTAAASAVILVGSIGLAQAQQSSGEQMMQQRPQQGQGTMQQRQRGQGMMDQQRRRMGPGMMGQQRGRMGPGMMGQRGWRSDRMGPDAGMMRIMFAIIDADGDGALSLEEVQEAHARIFKQVDADGDGRVTLEEIQAFFRGTPYNAAVDAMEETNDTGE